MRTGRKLVLFCALLTVGSTEAWSAPKPKPKVGLVPITSTGKKARRVARKVTRKLIKRLRKGRGKRSVVVIRSRASARLRTCLQDKACRLRESHKVGVSFWIIGHVMQIERRYHIDLQIMQKDVGVVGSLSVDGGKGKIIRGSVKGVRKLVLEAPAKATALAKKQKEDQARKEAVDKQVRRMDKSDDPPPEGSVVKAPLVVKKTDERGFFSSVFAARYWMGWTATGLAVASLGGAIGFGVISSSAVSDAEDDEITQVEAWKLQDKAQSNATMANVFFGVSAGLALGAAVLFYLEWRQERAEHTRMLQPSPTPEKKTVRLVPGLGGLSLVGTF